MLSLTTAVLLPITGRWVDRIGVRWPNVVGMLLVILGTFLLSLMLAAMKRDTRRAYRSAEFWVITAAGCFTTATLIGFSILMVNWMASRGSSFPTATLLLSTLLISGIAGTFLSGYIVDRARTHRVLPFLSGAAAPNSAYVERRIG